MPYIDPAERRWYEPQLSQLLTLVRRGKPGHLNYLVTRIALWYLGEEPRYEEYNAVIGALESAKLELYRRQVAGYEELKLLQNGDVA